MSFKFAVDVLFFLCSATFLLFVVVFDSRCVWAVFGGGAIFAGFNLRSAASDRAKTVNAVKWESGFTDWFIVVKSLTSAVGVAPMNIFRQEGWYTINTHIIVVGFLVLNITEAVIREVQLNLLENAITAIGLIFTLPFNPSLETISRLSIGTNKTHCFVFPLQVFWVLLYTSWNTCFVFGDNMSILTMLILIPPILLMYFGSSLLSLHHTSVSIRQSDYIDLLYHLHYREENC